MAMKVREFVERLNAIKASVKSGQATPEIEAELHRVTAALKGSCSPDELKAQIAGDADAPTALEEELTTLTMLWMRHRGATSG
jgi:hypothetical protein